MDHLYFSRAALWMLANDTLVVKDSFSSRAPRMITMDPWPRAVFMAASGTVTIGEFVDQLAAEYDAGAPAGLREQVHGVIRTLVDEEIVRTRSSSAALPAYFERDLRETPPAVRAQLLRADGLIE